MSVEAELNVPASDDISAASSAATINPISPGGSSLTTSVGYASSPVTSGYNARAIRPGRTRTNTGRIFSAPQSSAPPRASFFCTFGSPRYTGKRTCASIDVSSGRSFGSTRIARVKTRVIEPKVSTEQLAEKYPAIIIVNRGGFKLSFYKDLKLQKTYGIAVGQVGLETPAGLYHIQNKAINPAWHVPNSDWAGSLAGQIIPGGTPQNPLKARWMGIYNGAGIHGTDATGSIGTAASHGCIRMLIPDVIELYDQVPVGAPVYIA